jgi:hypothetical protein
MNRKDKQMRKIILSLLLTILLGSTAFAQGIYLPVASGTVTQANMKISAADGTSFIDFTAADVLTGKTGNLLVVRDSSGRAIQGFIKAAGTGETWSEKITGSNYDPDGSIADWVAYTSGGSGNTLTYDATLDAFKVTLGGTVGTNNGGILSTSFMGTIIPNGAIITTQAEIYLPSGHGFTGYFYVNDAGTFIDRVPYHYPPVIPINLSLVDQWQTVRYHSYLTRADVTGFLYVYAVGGVSGGVFYFRHPSLAQLITPSATGVTITSTKGGTTFNWAQKNSSFNYNDSSGYTYQIYKVLDAVVIDSDPCTNANATINLTAGSAAWSCTGIDDAAYQDGKHIIAVYDAAGVAAFGYYKASGSGAVVNTKGGSTQNWISIGTGFSTAGNYTRKVLYVGD